MYYEFYVIYEHRNGNTEGMYLTYSANEYDYFQAWEQATKRAAEILKEQKSINWIIKQIQNNWV